MTTFTMTDLVQAEQTLLGKMQENARLRDEFVANPREVILRELSIQVPPGLEVMPVEAREDALLVPIQAPGGIPARLPSLFSPELDQARNQLVERLGSDADFKREFLSDAKGVIAREFGVSVPSSMHVTPVEVPANALMVVIPPLVAEDGELSETELEAYAGGKKKKKIKSPIKIDIGKGGVSVGVDIPGTDIGASASVSVGNNGVTAGAEAHAFGLDKGIEAHVGPDGASLQSDFIFGSAGTSIDGQGLHTHGGPSGYAMELEATGDGVSGEVELIGVGMGAEGSLTGDGAEGSVDDKPNLPNVPVSPDASYAGNK